MNIYSTLAISRIKSCIRKIKYMEGVKKEILMVLSIFFILFYFIT